MTNKKIKPYITSKPLSKREKTIIFCAIQRLNVTPLPDERKPKK